MSRIAASTRKPGALLAVMLAAGCGGASPTAPGSSAAVTTTSVSINGSIDMMKVREGLTFTATATRSDGSTASVTDWSVDAPSVLSIGATTGAGTGVGTGQATITARHSGVVATRLIRVVPDYQGTWTGTYRLTSCADVGDFTLGGWCTMVQGATPGLAMAISQTRDAVTGTITFGSIPGSISGPIAMSGAITLSGTASNPTLSVEILSWNTNSTVFGAMTGTFTQRVTSPGLSGSATMACELLTFSKSGFTAAARRVSPAGPPHALDELLRALGMK